MIAIGICKQGAKSRHPGFTEGDAGMKVMVIVKASKESEAGAMPDRRC